MIIRSWHQKKRGLAAVHLMYVKRDVGRNNKGWKQKTVVWLKFVVQCI